MREDWNALTYEERKKALATAYTFYHKKGSYFNSQAQVPHLCQLIQDFQFTSLLDYGAGSPTQIFGANYRRRIVPSLRYYYAYDPYSVKKEVRAKPKVKKFDLVAATDVLEHILPEDIDDVIEELFAYTNKMLYVTICLSPAGKKICDEKGKVKYNQSLHTLVRPKKWWLKLFASAERKLKKEENRSISIQIVWT